MGGQQSLEDFKDPFSQKRQKRSKDQEEAITIRKDVIVKNILRDIRKYFSTEFNTLTSYNKKKRSKVESLLSQYLLEFVAHRFGSMLRKAPNQQQLTKELCFSLGCLVQPKRMLRREDLSVQERANVLKTYKTLY